MPCDAPLGTHFLFPSSYTITDALAATIACSLKEEMKYYMFKLCIDAYPSFRLWFPLSDNKRCRVFKIDFCTLLWVFNFTAGFEELCTVLETLKTAQVTVSKHLLRRDDTFGAKIPENETSMPLLYHHSIDIEDRSNKVYIFLKLRGSRTHFQL